MSSPDKDPNDESVKGSKLIPAALFLALGLVTLGRFLPGPFAWGFNHHAYLPVVIFAAWCGVAIVLLLPGVQRRFAIALSTRVPHIIYGTAWGPFAVALVAAGLFVLFRERSFFMGDGYLVAELVERGQPFRAFDNMDYLLHFQTYKSQLSPTGNHLSAFTIYRISSVIAGFLGALLLVRLTGRLTWEPWRKLVALGFFLLAGPVALFHGYIESYSFLFAALSAFLVTSILVLEGRAPLWLASTFFGAGLFFHLTAVFSGPALLYLALKAPVKPAGRRWVEAAGPTAVLFLLSILLHLAAGYGMEDFRTEFIDNKNVKSIWIPLSGGRGLFSFYHWKDLLNLVLLVAPVATVLVLAQSRRLASRIRDPRVQLLLVHSATLVVFAIVIDRKLGGARDWDLLAAHSLGIGLLASVLLPGSGVVPAGRTVRTQVPKAASLASALHASRALTVSFLVTVPWIALLHLEPRSIERFLDVAADFPDFARAYAYEEVAKYYRKAEDYDRALELYQLCVETYPSNGRFHVLLGSLYLIQHNRAESEEKRKELVDLGEKHYREAVRLLGENELALDSLAKALLLQGRHAEAVDVYKRLIAIEGGNPVYWEGMAFAQLQSDQLEGAAESYRQVLSRNRNARVRQALGAAYLGLGQYQEAATAFAEAMANGETDPRLRFGLAAAKVYALDAAVAGGSPPDPARLADAELAVQEALRQAPNDPNVQDLTARLAQLRQAR